MPLCGREKFMNITAKCKVDMRYAKLVAGAVRPKTKIIRLLLFLLYLGVFIYNIAYLIQITGSGYSISELIRHGFLSLWDIALVILPLAFIIIGVVMQLTLPRRMYKRSGAYRDTVNEFVFTDDALTARTNAEGMNESASVAYSSLVKLTETDDYFMIFPDNKRFLVVDKATVEGGTVDDLREKLLSVPGIEYKRKRR